MTCRTLGIRTAVASAAACVSVGLLGPAGCTREERTTTARSAAQVASASVITTAAGQSTTTPSPSRRSTGVKLNGRGGFDASEAQRNALKRAHYVRDHHNDAFKPFRPSTQPTSQPTTRP